MLGVLSIFASRILAKSPEITESIYRNTVFYGYRWIWDTTLGWVPFPVMLLVFIFYFLHAVRLWRRRWLFNYKPWFRLPLNFLGGLILWFYLAWGFNYSAVGLVDKLNIDTSTTADLSGLRAMAVQKASAARQNSEVARFQETHVSSAEMHTIHNLVREFLQQTEVATPGLVRVRVISLNGWMRRMGVSGIYLPFSGECHVDGSYPLLQQWFTIAHEIAHGYGITDEGECNFVAFMALQASADDSFVYAAWFSLLLELVPRSEFEMLPSELAMDRLMLRQNAERYPPYIPRLAEKTNHLFLKSQGVDDGIESYDRWPMMVQAVLSQN